MSVIALVLVFLTFSISVFNFITIRKPENDDLVSESVTVIVPMRNESENVAECISALAGQSGIAELKVILVNDSSTDDTQALIQRAIAGDSRFTVIDSPELRTGWLGKVSALQAGYEAAHSEFIVTIDADVRLNPKALARAINQLKDLKLDFVSPYPQQVAVTFAEKLIQPLLHWSWMSTVVLRLAEKYPVRSTAIANGQFFVVKTEAYIASGGHKSIKGEVIDDMELAKSLKRNGFKGGVTNGSKIASCRMYQNWSQLRNGYQKSLWRAFKEIPNAIVLSLLLIVFFIYPVFEMIKGSLIGLVSYFLVVLSRMITAKLSRGNLLASFLHPLSILLFIYLLITSWIQHSRGNLSWKGRKL